MDSFPDEIITIMFLNLPVESILRCRSVCKSWCKIIDNPKFAEIHFNSSKPQLGDTSSLLLLSNFSDELYIGKIVDATLSGILLKSTPFQISCKRSTCNFAEPPVNGLLFMYPHSNYDSSSENESSCSMYICNPATRDCVQLPIFNHIQCSQATLIRGFGFDAISNEFKVMQMATYVGGRSNDTESEVQVYTLGSNSWKNVGKAPDSKFVKVMSAFVNGSSHWLAVSGSGDSDNPFPLFSMDIVSFNFSSEKFGVIPTPEFGFVTENNTVPEPAYFELTVLGECLSVVDCSFEHHMEIWVMKEYNVKKSWTRYSVTKYYMDRQFSIIQAISLHKDSEIVLLYGASRLVSYNIERKTYTPFEVDGIPRYSIQHGCSPLSYQVYSFVESLFSLKPDVE
ncbi:hypothetical protein ACHQM5_004073 [Ranunculus cassubicifolius]